MGTDVKNLLEVLESGGKLANVVKALQDGFQIEDMDEIVMFLSSLPKAIDGISTIPTEIEDMDEDEGREVIKILDKFGIKPEQRQQAFDHFIFGALHITQGALILKNSMKKG